MRRICSAARHLSKSVKSTDPLTLLGSGFHVHVKRRNTYALFSLPIGAFSPRQWMSSVHCSPSDAVQVHRDIKSQFSVGMHWGTFVLTDEPVTSPPRVLKEEAAKIGLAQDAFVVMDIGQTIALPDKC